MRKGRKKTFPTFGQKQKVLVSLLKQLKILPSHGVLPKMKELVMCSSTAGKEKVEPRVSRQVSQC